MPVQQLDPTLTATQTGALLNRQMDSLTWAHVGDSRGAAQYNDTSFRVRTNTFFPNWADSMFFNRSMKTVYNGCVSGNRSDQYLVFLPNAIASGAKNLMICGPVINDISQSGSTGDTLLVIFNRIKTAINTAIAAGMTVWIWTEAGGTSLNTAGLRGMVNEFNERLIRLGDVTAGLNVFDLAKYKNDPQSATLAHNTSYSSDTTHDNNYGSYYLAFPWARFVQSKLGKSLHGLTSVTDVIANGTTAYSQEKSNPLFLTTTGGTPGTGNSGTLPSGMIGSRTGSASMVWSVVTGLYGGNAVRGDFTFTAAGETIQVKEDTTVAHYSLGNDYVTSGCLARVAAGHSGLANIALNTNFSSTPNPVGDMFAAATIQLPSDPINLTLQSENYVIPIGATWATWSSVITAAAAGVGTIFWEAPWIKRRTISLGV